MQQYNYNQKPFFTHLPQQPPVYYISQQKTINLNSQDTSKKSFLSHRLIQLAIDLIVIGIIFAAFGIVYNKLDPRIRYFHCTDSDIFFPNLPDIIPFWIVGIYGTIGPLVLILIIEAYNALINKDRISFLSTFAVCVYYAISLFALGIALTLLITEVGKRWVGRLRPHFIGTLSNGIYNSIYTGGSFCTGDAADILDGRLSFPSGHSSYSTFTMLFLIIYIQARLVLYKLRFIKPLLQISAFLGAYVTCVSRISDHHHRGSDVIGGIAIGAIVAFFITTVVSRILWYYRTKTDYNDIELIPNMNA